MALWSPSMPQLFEPLQAISLGRQEENPGRLTDLPPEVLNLIFDHLFHDTIVHVFHKCIDLPEYPQRNNINRPIHLDLQILLVCKSLSSQAMDSFLHAALFVCHYTACQKEDVDVCLHSDSTIAAAKYFKQIRRFSTASHELLLYFGLIKFEEEIGFVTPYSQRTALPESRALRELDFEFDMDVDIKRLRRQPPSIPKSPFRSEFFLQQHTGQIFDAHKSIPLRHLKSDRCPQPSHSN